MEREKEERKEKEIEFLPLDNPAFEIAEKDEEIFFPKTEEELNFENEDADYRDFYACCKVKTVMLQYCEKNSVDLMKNITEKKLYNFLASL